MKVDLVKYQMPKELRPQKQNSWQVPTNRIELYRWSRYLIENNAYAHMMINTMSEAAIHGFYLKGFNGGWFTQELKGLQIENTMKNILKEYFGLGDCFTLLSLDCPVCSNNSHECSHKGAHFSAINILDPQNIEIVSLSPDLTNPMIFLRPTQELKKIVTTGQPKKAYEQIPENIKNCIRKNDPFQLSPKYVYHFKSNTAYVSYGVPMLWTYVVDLIQNKAENVVINVDKEVQYTRIEEARTMLSTWLLESIMKPITDFHDLKAGPEEMPEIKWGELRKND